MKGRIERCFERLRTEGRAGLITYITAGDPSLARTVDHVRALERAGVDIVELGIPFSDPLADGRSNQAAAERALRAGATFAGLLETIQGVRTTSDIPIVLYSYLNPLLAHGFEEAVRRLRAAGADGLLALDLTPEEGLEYHRILRRHGMDSIGLVTPTSTPERIRRIVRHTRGFVYCISRAGVTGARETLSDDAAVVLQRAHAATKLPCALGFGIAAPDTAAQAARMADAVVVGSALVDRLHAAEQAGGDLEPVMDWVRELARAIREAPRD